MNPTPDTTAAGNGGTFDPREAAALLGETTQQARRQLEPFPPWLLAVRGVGALVVYGGIWLSVLGQHPYLHPTVAAVPGAIAFGVVNLIATVAVARRATAGVTGRSRLRPAEFVIAAVLWLGVFAVMGALIGAGVRDTITYGLYPACAPPIVAGLTWVAIMAARSSWRRCGQALAVVVVGAVSLAAGPAGAWLAVGVGICIVLLGTAAVISWRQRA